MQRADGSRFPVLMDVVSVRDEQGKIIYRIATQLDMTEIDRASKALARKEDQLQMAVSAAGMGAWEIDLITNDVFWSAEYAGLLGLRSEDSPKKSEDFRKFVHPDDRELMVKVTHEALEKRLPFACEFRVILPDGSIRWIYEVGRHILNNSGKPVRVMGLGMDITQRKNAHEELRIAHDRMKQFVDANVVGIATATADGSIVEANDYYLDLIGYTRAEYEAGLVNWRSITPPEWLPADEKAIKELRETGRCEQYEKEYQRRDGTRVSVLINDALLSGPEGQIAAFVVDITARRQAEKRVQNLTRLYATLSQVNQAVVREKDEAGLFRAICRMSVDFGGFNLAWIGLYDQEKGEVKAHTSISSGSEHLPFTKINIRKPPFKKGLIGQSAASGHVSFSNDIHKDASFGYWRNFPLAKNFHSAAVVPFSRGGKIAGFLVLLAAELKFFADQDMRLLLEEMGGDITFALDGFENDRLRMETEKELFRSQQILSLFVEHAPAAIAMFDRDMRYLAVSKRYLDDYGIGEANIIGRSHYEIFPEITDKIKAVHQRGLNGATEHRDEAQFIRADGKTDWVNWTVQPWYEADGRIGGIILFTEIITEKMEARLKLEESEHKFATLFSKATIPTALTKFPEHTFIDVNDAWQQLFGFEKAEVVGKDAVELGINKNSPDRDKTLDAIRQRKPRPNHELVLFNRSGEPIDILINTDIITIEGEEYFLNSYNDITALKKAQTAVQKSEERYRTTLESMLEGGQIISKDWDYLYLNDAAAAQARLPKEALVGKNFLEVWPGIEKSPLFKRMKESLQKQVPVEFENRFEYPDGSVSWFYLSIQPIPEGLFILSSDMTQRKLAEERAARLLERLDLATGAARIGIWDWDILTSELIWDEQMFEVYGVSSENFTVSYDAWLQCIHPEDRARTDENSRMALRGEKDYDTEFRIICPDGTEHWIKASGQVFKDKKGKPSRMVGVNYDITDQKMALLEIQHRTDDLVVINAINEAINNGEDISGIAQVFARETHRILNCQDAAIYILSPDGKYLEMQGMTLPRSVVDKIERLIGRQIPKVRVPVRKGSYLSYLLEQQNGFITDDPETIKKWIMEFTQTNYLPEILREPIRKAVPLIFKALNIRSTMSIPLVMKEKTVGLLDMSSRRAFNEEDLQRVRSLRHQITSAILRKQAEQNEKTQLEHISALQNIDKVISSSFDMRVTLDVLTNAVISELGADAVAIQKYNPFSQTLEFVAGRGFSSQRIRNYHIRLGDGLLGSIGLERRTRYVHDLKVDEFGFTRKDLLKDDPFVEYVGVPLVAKGALKGVLEVFNRLPLGQTADWINYLETLAGQAAIAIDNAQLFEGLQRSNTELATAYDATIEGWSQAMDLRDKETEGHTQRVVKLTLEMARRMGISENDLVHVRRGALLHDIGKLGVPDNVLLKTDKLSDAEWALMRQHPEFAHNLLSPITYLRQALDIPYCHHEKWDGSGYPRGLKAEQIPLAARLFAIVDVWDALTSDRPYRPAWTKKKVLQHIRSLSGKHFDPKAVEIFLQLVSEKPDLMA